MRTRSRPSAALIVSIVALLVALGGTGYAAFRLPAGSVGTKQLKNGAVTAPKVKLHSLLAADFKKGQLPAGSGGSSGSPGSSGSSGSQGPPGPPGPAGTARAFGVVSAAGALNSARSKGIAGVGHPAVGTYCIALAAGIGSSSTTPVAAPDEADPASTSKAVAHVNTSAPDCPAGQLEVVMRKFSVDNTTTPGTPTLVDHHTDNGFSFVVP